MSEPIRVQAVSKGAVQGLSGDSALCSYLAVKEREYFCQTTRERAVADAATGVSRRQALILTPTPVPWRRLMWGRFTSGSRRRLFDSRSSTKAFCFWRYGSEVAKQSFGVTTKKSWARTSYVSDRDQRNLWVMFASIRNRRDIAGPSAASVCSCRNEFRGYWCNTACYSGAGRAKGLHQRIVFNHRRGLVWCWIASKKRHRSVSISERMTSTVGVRCAVYTAILLFSGAHWSANEMKWKVQWFKVRSKTDLEPA